MNAPLTMAPTSLRDALPAEPRPILLLEGPRRTRWLLAYAALHLFIFGGLATTLSWSPALLLFSLGLAYVLENILFVFGHVGLHASFIETPEPQMTTITHHSFAHHYRDIRAYDRTWLASRMSYFICPRNGFHTLTSYIYLVAPVLSAGLVALVDWRVGLCLLSSIWGAHALQAVCHEWYHHPRRAGFYWWPTRALLTGFERVGLMSTRGHIEHHRHHLYNLDEVHTWVDLYVPGADRLGDAMWAWAVDKHVPGERRMLEALQRFAGAYYPLHFVVLTGTFAALAWWA